MIMTLLLSQINNTLGLTWGNRLVGYSCLCPQQQNKHGLFQWVTCWQRCSATVVLETALLCYCTPGATRFFCQRWVLLGEKLSPHAASGLRWPSVSIQRPQKWWLKGTRCHDPRSAPQPLENNGASFLALCIYAVVGLWQGWCVCPAYGLQWQKAGWVGTYYPCIVSAGKQDLHYLTVLVCQRKEAGYAESVIQTTHNLFM